MPYLSVAKVPLQAQSWYMQDWQSMDAKDWAPGLQATFLVEDALHAQGQASRGKLGISIWKNDLRGYPGISWDIQTWYISRDNLG